MCRPLNFLLQCLEVNGAKTDAPTETEVTDSAGGQVNDGK